MAKDSSRYRTALCSRACLTSAATRFAPGSHRLDVPRYSADAYTLTRRLGRVHVQAACETRRRREKYRLDRATVEPPLSREKRLEGRPSRRAIVRKRTSRQHCESRNCVKHTTEQQQAAVDRDLEITDLVGRRIRADGSETLIQERTHDHDHTR